MKKRKITKKYYFSVEGETEQWYLKWLEKQINNADESICNVSLDCPVQKNPLKRAKSITITKKTEIWHLSDYESDEKIHTENFIEIMNQMKKAGTLGKQIIYKFGYSNLTFDLWIILHKIDCNGFVNHRKNYINYINRAYNEHFENMDMYKHESNFKRCLQKLQLKNVIDAIKRAKIIMDSNKDNGYILQQYKGYYFYKENPSLAIWEIIEKILKDCKLM